MFRSSPDLACWPWMKRISPVPCSPPSAATPPAEQMASRSELRMAAMAPSSDPSAPIPCQATRATACYGVLRRATAATRHLQTRTLVALSSGADVLEAEDRGRTLQGGRPHLQPESSSKIPIRAASPKVSGPETKLECKSLPVPQSLRPRWQRTRCIQHGPPPAHGIRLQRASSDHSPASFHSGSEVGAKRNAEFGNGYHNGQMSSPPLSKHVACSPSCCSNIMRHHHVPVC